MQDSYPDHEGALFRRYHPAAPGAGNSLTQVIEDGTIFEPILIATTFVTDATVATRNIRLEFEIAGQTFTIGHHPVAITASQTVLLSWHAGTGLLMPTAFNLNFHTGFAAKLRLYAPDVMRIIADNIQAGDAFTQPIYCGRNWASPTII